MTELEDRSDGPVNPYTRVIVEASARTAPESMICCPPTPNSGPSAACLLLIETSLRIGAWEVLWANDVPTGVCDQRGG